MSDAGAIPPSPPPPPPPPPAPAATPSPAAAAPESPAARNVATDSFASGGAPSAAARGVDRFDPASAPAPGMPTLSSVQRGKDALAADIQADAARRTEEAARERATDGKYVGPNGVSANRDEAGAFRPQDGKLVSDKPAYLINGINTTAEQHSESAAALAERLRRPVYAIHNATSGALRDVGESVYQKANGFAPATRTIANEMSAALGRGETIDIYAHSQGALFANAAVQQARGSLWQQGYSRADAEKKLGNINVQSFGGAVQNWTNGPSYTHHVNSRDYVAIPFGQGRLIPEPVGRALNIPYIPGITTTHPGRGATVNTQSFPGDPHSFSNYLKWAVPQAQVN